MTNEAYLSQIGELSRRIDYHRERLHRMCLEADAVSSRWGEHGGTHTGDAPYVRMLERIEEYREQLEGENDLLLRLQAQAEEAIARLPEEKMRLVLLYKYMEGKSYLQIGDLMYMAKATAKQWQVRALKCLTLPDDPIVICS